MPHEWNNIMVVTEAELVPGWYSNLKTLQQEIHRHKDKPYGIKKVQSGGNGRQLLVSFDSLPNEIKNGLGDPRKHNHVLEAFYKIDTGAVSFYGDFLFDGVGLPSKLQTEYITNASVLAACVELMLTRTAQRIQMGKKPKKIMATVLADAISFNATLQVKHGVQHTLPVSEKRFKEWFAAFNVPTGNYKYNYASLITGKLGNQNRRLVTETVLQLLNDMFAGQSHKPTRTDIMRTYDGFLQGYVRVINTDTGELYDPQDFKPLSETTIVSYLGAWTEKAGSYKKRSGNSVKLAEQFIAPVRYKKVFYAGSRISVDDRQPPFEYAKGERVWFYLAQDLGSGAFTCWVHGKSKEGLLIDFYRQMVRNYHGWGLKLPKEIEAEASLNYNHKDTFLLPGRMFEHVSIKANNPRGKAIERTNRVLRYEKEKELEGWKPRPFSRTEANQEGPHKVPIIPYDQIVNQSLKILQDYNNEPHREAEGKSKWQYFTENQHPEAKPINWRGILPWLGYTTTTTCRDNGLIHLQNDDYMLGMDGAILTGEALIEKMAIIGGKKVSCVWLDGNDGKVMKAFVYLNDCIVCEAIVQPRASRSQVEETEADREAEAITMRYRNTITTYMSMKAKSISEVVVINDKPKLPQHFVIPELQASRQEEREGAAEILPEATDDYTPFTIPTNNTYSSKNSLYNRL